MGCDIHLYTEVRRKKAGKSSWVSTDKWTRDEDGIQHAAQIWRDRNYDTFAVLADVRNGIGFAGVKTGGKLEPISQPRGLPKDVSTQVAAEYRSWEGDAHSMSWHTLAQLLAYDWTQEIVKTGYVNGPTYANWSGYAKANGGSPREWCGDVSGPQTVKITEEKLLELIAETRAAYPDYTNAERFIESNLSRTYVRLSWKQPLYKRCSAFLSEAIPQLLRLDKDPNNVRIVFWFDN